MAASAITRPRIADSLDAERAQLVLQRTDGNVDNIGAGRSRIPKRGKGFVLGAEPRRVGQEQRVRAPDHLEITVIARFCRIVSV